MESNLGQGNPLHGIIMSRVLNGMQDFGSCPLVYVCHVSLGVSVCIRVCGVSNNLHGVLDMFPKAAPRAARLTT